MNGSSGGHSEEARTLLLSLDPLADLALVQDQIHQRLMDLTPTDSTDLQALWKETQSIIDSALDDKPARTSPNPLTLEAQYHVLVTCRDEAHQIELLRRFQQEGIPCKALLS
jgi:hypothetical protein